jgi:Tfp pilus assembly protein PilN
MIKINLLPQKRPKLRGVAGAEASPRDMLIGAGSIVGVALVVWLLADRPMRKELGELRETNDQLQAQINQKKQKLQGYEVLKAAAEKGDERENAIKRLMSAKIVPAHVLHELGDILTQGHMPTMTTEMTAKTGTNGDPNKRFDPTWDPTHVWLTSFADTKGDFTLEGGAQTEVDVTQLSKRLAASVYFADVAPSRQERVADKESGVTYYKFTITGKVAY